MMIFAFFFAAAFLLVPAAACGGVSLWETTKQTFRPISWRQFFFPPCPFCWAVRGFATAGIALMIIR